MAFWRAAHIRALLQYKIFNKALRLASWANKDPDLTQGKVEYFKENANAHISFHNFILKMFPKTKMNLVGLSAAVMRSLLQNL